jgi:hypothetical protein
MTIGKHVASRWRVLRLRLLVAASLFAALVVFGRPTLAGESAEQTFWEWFAANEDMLFAYETDQERIFDLLEAELHKIDKRLAFLFGPNIEGKREFIVSADGRLEAFPIVRRVIKAAPSLPRWTIVAFRPRNGSGFQFRYGGASLHMDDVFFAPALDGEFLGVFAFIPDEVYARGKVGRDLAWLALDSVLGEYDLATKISYLEVRPASQIGHYVARGVRVAPIGELADLVDRMPKRLPF